MHNQISKRKESKVYWKCNAPARFELHVHQYNPKQSNDTHLFTTHGQTKSITNANVLLFSD